MKPVNLLLPEHEHEFEAAHGLPETLPAGETLLWQGSPRPMTLARQVLHIDWVMGYFAALMLWRCLASLHDGAGLGQAMLDVARMLPLIGLALAVLALMAWMMARTTVYTLTTERVVMRIGMVLSITFNLPFSRIVSAGLRPRGNGTGDIALTLAEDDHIAYLHLWPHARPWHVKRTEPMLRGVTGAAEVARILSQALARAEAEALKLPQAGAPTRRAPNGRSPSPASNEPSAHPQAHAA